MPIYLIFVVVLLSVAFSTLRYNKIIFLINVGLALISLAVVLILILRFKHYIKTTVGSTLSSMYNVPDNYIETVKTACAVFGESGEILLYNEKFRKFFFSGGELVNENIFDIFTDETIDSLTISDDGVQLYYNNKKFLAFVNKVDKGYMIALVDNTYYKDIEKEYFDTQKSVALIMFDNAEDFLSDSDETGAHIVVTVDKLLSRWSVKHNCLYRKLPDNRYMIIFDELVLLSQIEKKFRILDKIRQVTHNGRQATLSIGIGRGCKNLRDSHTNAKKALDMALGRGGDQVAILTDGEYQFFGGVSKGVEKTSKVRVRVFAQSVKSAIEQCDKVLIMGHNYSDLDCIGAATGIYSVVTKTFSKPAYIMTDTEKSMASDMIDKLSARNKDMFVSPERAFSLSNKKTLLFIVDTHSKHFVESQRVFDECGKYVVIDHHRKMVNFIDNADVFFHEPTASSASEMVTELISYLGDDCLSKEEAEALLAGIMLDTKNFIVNTGVRTFEAAAYLKKKGADTVAVRNIFANSVDIYKEKYKLVSNAQIVNNCAISVVEGNVKNPRLVSAQAADDMLTIRDVYASFVISKLDSKTVNISARSYGKINVQLIMEKLGGGGHQTMAAVQLTDISIEDAKKKLIENLT